jgi:LysR family transcriptional activator of mexEF-oprN operon
MPKPRNVRCSVSSFANLGAIVDGSALLATVPSMVADQIRAVRPHLRTRPVPFALAGASSELLWPVTTDDDEPCRFARAHIIAIADKVK